ncbi:unnamed protein product [Lactuca saligna]|uniref:Uncharacterized protein n=1 Tax=Lactuca saligna TaxID=75948 RepID=A0AA35V7C0_LACSI|nr:unnamed protein product [Lactuca saligna]
MGELEFSKVHNSTIFLENPLAAHNNLKFIVDSLKKCCLVHALTTSPVIYQNLIKDFWRSAIVMEDDKEEKYLEANIQGKKILISESVIRESLQINDRAKYSMEIDLYQTQEVLDHMGYEGSFPPTGISDDLPSSIELNLDDDELGPFPGFDSRCFENVNEVAQPTTKTGEEVNALKILLSSSKSMEVSSGQIDVISKIPPSDSTVSTSAPLLSESTQQQTSQSSLKGSRSD